jgi:hypothetical protein
VEKFFFCSITTYIWAALTSDCIFKLLRIPGIDSWVPETLTNSALFGRYDNPIPYWFLAPIDCFKILALNSSAIIYELMKTQPEETLKLKVVSLFFTKKTGRWGEPCLAGDQVLETRDCQPGCIQNI